MSGGDLNAPLPLDTAPARPRSLTWVLADCLSGDSKTLMFVNLSPVVANAEESFCSLNFAGRVKNVELGRAGKNVTQGKPGAGGGAGTGARRGSTVPDSGDDGDYITGTGDDDDGGDAGDDGEGASPMGRTPVAGGGGSGLPRAPPAGGIAGNRASVGRRPAAGGK